VLVQEQLAARAGRLGEGALATLREALDDEPSVGEVRGLGLLIGIELVSDRETREPDPRRATAVLEALFERGVVSTSAGHDDNVLKISPPLTIPEPELREGLGQVVAAIRGVR
jgi:4-aminobutyrate aminotransferase-like enzyme